jgi:hypothetical protein
MVRSPVGVAFVFPQASEPGVVTACVRHRQLDRSHVTGSWLLHREPSGYAEPAVPRRLGPERILGAPQSPEQVLASGRWHLQAPGVACGD